MRQDKAPVNCSFYVGQGPRSGCNIPVVAVAQQGKSVGRAHGVAAARPNPSLKSRAPTALGLAGEAAHVNHRPRRPSPSLLVPA